jgi:hypothetical protein
MSNQQDDSEAMIDALVAAASHRHYVENGAPPSRRHLGLARLNEFSKD